MQSLSTPETPPEVSTPIPKARVSTEPDFNSPPRPIAEFVGLPDFPRCAVGAYVDIGGFAGIVADIVNNSIKVRSPEGISQSFNFNRLRMLYGPPPAKVEPLVASPEPERPRERPQSFEQQSERPTERATERVPERIVERPSERFERVVKKEEPAPRPVPRREVVSEPDFSQPVKLINVLAGRADFPKCALGEHVEIVGYSGVVVEIVNQSLKVLSIEGTTRSYNAQALKKLHGGG